MTGLVEFLFALLTTIMFFAMFVVIIDGLPDTANKPLIWTFLIFFIVFAIMAGIFGAYNKEKSNRRYSFNI